MNKRTKCAFIIVVLTCYLIIPQAAFSQTRESGEWWPNAEWGPEDQAGASNRISPEKVLNSLSLVTKGDIYELGQIYSASMPLMFGRSYTMILPQKGSGSAGDNRLVGNVEFISSQIGQVGTQFDGLGHIGREVDMPDGHVERIFYNGFTASEMDSGKGLKKLGIEHVKPIITKGILIDIAAYKSVSVLPNSYEVTLNDVLESLKKQGMTQEDIEPGDAVFFNYGWSSLWKNSEASGTNPPGIGMEVARWIAEKKVTLVGSDSYGTEVYPNPDPGLVFPVHQELLMKHGIFNIENMTFEELLQDGVYEFLFVVTTIRFEGATGSPIRPIAIR